MPDHIKQNNREVREFLKSIISDFYLDIHKYNHYADKDFYTHDLTITQMLQICESYILISSTVKYIRNKLDISKIISLTLERVYNCDDDKLTNEAAGIIYGMDCYTSSYGKGH